MIDPETAMRQAWMTASDYAAFTLDELADKLDIDRSNPGWQAQLAPFASVWAAMIAAASADFNTAVTSGVVEVPGRGVSISRLFADEVAPPDANTKAAPNAYADHSDYPPEGASFSPHIRSRLNAKTPPD